MLDRIAELTGLPDSNPRVEPAIDHICEQVREDISHADHEHATLHDAIITLSNSILDEQQSEPGPAENLFGNNRACQQNAELQTENRHHRNQAILQHVFVDNRALAQTLRTRGSNIIFPKLFDNLSLI